MDSAPGLLTALLLAGLTGLGATPVGPPHEPPRASAAPGGAAVRAEPAGSGQPRGSAAPAGRWAWPVGGAAPPALLAPFAAPRTRWGPGHRGADLAAAVGDPVRAVDDGEITHRGRVAGRPTITVAHRGGLRSTYEPVVSDLEVGDRVRRGEVIGRLSPDPGHCRPRGCLHLGARLGPDYLDPLTLLVRRRVVLLPVP